MVANQQGPRTWKIVVIFVAIYFSVFWFAWTMVEWITGYTTLTQVLADEWEWLKDLIGRIW